MPFTYNGVDLTPFLSFIKAKRTIGNERKLTTEDILGTGEELQEVTFGAKTIEVTVSLASREIAGSRFIDTTEYLTVGSEELNELRDQIARVLNTRETHELVLPDEPNRYYNAIPTGDVELEGISNWYDETTIKFFVPDGVAHISATRSFNFVKNDFGVYEAEIVNDGSEDAYVNYKIKLKKESGYVGIVSEYGAMQFGKYDESDGYMDKKNVTVLSNQKGDFANWTDGTINYENTRKIITTQMSADTSFGGRLGLLPSSFKTSGTSGALQYGAVKEYTLSDPISQWYIWARAWFETGLMGQTGAWCLTVLDESNHLIAGMAIEKDDTVGNTANVRFLMGDGSGGSRTVKTIPFTPSYWIPPNPYGSEGRATNSNMFDLVKEKDRVQFFWYGGYYPYYDSRLANVKAKKIQFFVGQYAGRNTTDRLVTHHYLNDFSFYQLHVDYWKDVPNRYPSGSTIAIDGEKGQIKVNNQIRLDDEILGTTYFKVPPGKTKVQLMLSSFAEITSATATIQEVYI
ncbi:distal tail protein Dit [Streptococcus lutetiensis]|jgi:predicted phage tail component-like protein|uniref:distal tail protein Dit n=1 Tax=Streptococcus lutetiensis TaxID=150055 RepID=UPI001BDA55BB|nr:distal tail protein Dit [Streptococcus lutetiensis]MBT0929301.1 phage tail family protein [Streptococcus lutetiensis]